MHTNGDQAGAVNGGPRLNLVLRGARAATAVHSGLPLVAMATTTGVNSGGCGLESIFSKMELRSTTIMPIGTGHDGEFDRE